MTRPELGEERFANIKASVRQMNFSAGRHQRRLPSDSVGVVAVLTPESTSQLARRKPLFRKLAVNLVRISTLRIETHPRVRGQIVPLIALA